MNEFVELAAGPISLEAEMTWLQYAALTWKPAFSIGRIIHLQFEVEFNSFAFIWQGEWTTWKTKRVPVNR